MDRGGVAEAFMLAHALVARPEVKRAWSEPSACEDMTVGGLSVHLLRQSGHVVRCLSAPPPLDRPIGLLDHYDRADWVGSGHDSAVNIEIRTRDNAAAKAGPIAVLAESASVLSRLPGLLDRQRDPDWVHLPWQGWNLYTQDFLTTRAMELVVHSDDLATSVDVAPPPFSATVTMRVVDLLSSLAVHRHGSTAVVRALSRPQRAPGNISAF